jgi:putative ABC transport system permease protein
MFDEIRYSIRTMLKNPSFTAVAVLTMALGIGATTAIFSVLDAVLLQPLPYPEADRLVALWEARESRPGRQSNISLPDFLDWRAQNGSFESASAYTESTLTRTGDGEPEHLSSAVVSVEFFRTLDVAPALGPGFAPDNETYGNHRVAVISDGYWQRSFGADPNVVGRQIALDGQNYPIVGVLPAGFRVPLFAEEPEVWVPLTYQQEDLDERGAHYLRVVARLKPGVDLARARTDMGALSSRLAELYPGDNTGHSAGMGSLRDEIVGDVRPLLLVLLGAVALVLLIACANVANLLLARATVRHREVAVRLALGAGRWRLIRQFLVESVIIAVIGGAIGLALAAWGVDALVAMNAEGLPRTAEIGIDMRVLFFTLAITVVTGIAFGLVPALHASDVGLNDALKESGRSVAAGRNRARSTFVVVQVALSLVLLVGSGLLLRSLYMLQTVDHGFDSDNVLTMYLSLPEATYPDSEQQLPFVRALGERLQEIPGVTASGLVLPLPYSDTTVNFSYRVDDEPEGVGAQSKAASWRGATPGYFRALGIPVVRGRGITDADAEGAQKVIVINETMARTCFGDGDPIGHRLTIGYNDTTCEIVGVVGDTRFANLRTAPTPEMYTSLLQTPWDTMGIVVRADGNPTALAGIVRDRVASIDKTLPVYDVKPMESRLSDSLRQDRFGTVLIGLFAAVALILASIGIYGVMAYLVERRTHEIGILMALGAQPRDVVRLVVGRGMALTLAGILLGVVGAFGLMRLLESLLYGVGTTDPIAFGGMTVVLAAVALAACYIPARRAARIDPAIALRSE